MACSVGHIALFVTDLHEAEAFYRQVFEMDAVFREAEGDDGHWYTLPSDRGWDDAETAAVEIGMVALQRDGFVLPIFNGAPESGTVLEIGIEVPLKEIKAIDRRLPDGATRLPHQDDDLMFADPFGFVWHINSNEAPFLRKGEGAGLWLDI